MDTKYKDMQSFSSEDLSHGNKRRRRGSLSKKVIGQENQDGHPSTANGFCSFISSGESLISTYKPRINVFGASQRSVSHNTQTDSDNNHDSVLLNANKKGNNRSHAFNATPDPSICKDRNTRTPQSSQTSRFNSFTPLSDITNIQPATHLRSKRKKVFTDITNGTRLFDSIDSDTRETLLDYHNIEPSEIDGVTSFVDDISILEAYVGSDIEQEVDAIADQLSGQLLYDPWCQKMISEVPEGYKSLGAPTAECLECGAKMWKEERVNKKVTKQAPKFSLCCGKGRVRLPPARPTPSFLLSLYNSQDKGSSFRKCIRMYNSMFSFTSMGGNVDRSINKGGAPFVYRLNGQNHHQFGSLLPREGDQPRFCQLYIYDTENEIGNRIRCININDTNNVDADVVEGLLKMLDENNHLVRCFRMARDRFRDEQIVDLKIVLKVSRSESGRENHISPSNEVAAVMVGDIEDTCGQRDIVIESKIDGLKRISDVHPLLMALQYPLLFPYGEDGFHEKMYYVRQPNEPPLLFPYGEDGFQYHLHRFHNSYISTEMH